MTKSIFPAISRTVLVEAKHSMFLQLARTGLAIERYRMKTGALPASLNDIVPHCHEKVPVDVFSNKPIRYKRLQKGFVLYSIGENKRDDRGENDMMKGLDDISFQVLR